jgi:hypothetical protein
MMIPAQQQQHDNDEVLVAVGKEVATAATETDHIQQRQPQTNMKKE